MKLPAISHPALDFVRIQLQARIERARSEDLDRGASAVEWVIISAIVVAIVVVVGGILYKALNDRAGKVSTCIGSADNTAGSDTCK